MPRYRFSEFILSPRRRVLVRNGRELPLIPRYFDLLVFLVERRSEAVHRREIFERIWSDVIVSDSALSQAIRTIRRVLEDDSREPRFVRTVSRHGYRFVFADVVEEDDESDWQDDRLAAPLQPCSTGGGSRSVRAALTTDHARAGRLERRRGSARGSRAVARARNIGGDASSWNSPSSHVRSRVVERHTLGCGRSGTGPDSE